MCKTLESAQKADKFLEEENKGVKKSKRFATKNHFVCLDRPQLMDDLKLFNANMNDVINTLSENSNPTFTKEIHKQIVKFSQLIEVELNRVENTKKWQTKGFIQKSKELIYLKNNIKYCLFFIIIRFPYSFPGGLKGIIIWLDYYWHLSLHSNSRNLLAKICRNVVYVKTKYENQFANCMQNTF